MSPISLHVKKDSVTSFFFSCKLEVSLSRRLSRYNQAKHKYNAQIQYISLYILHIYNILFPPHTCQSKHGSKCSSPIINL